MRALLRLARRVDALSTGSERAVSILVVLMIALGAYNALARHLGKALGATLASNAFIEAQWYLFSVVFLIGAAGALRADAHVRVDVLYARMAERTKAVVDVVGAALLLLPFCAYGLYASWGWAAHSIAEREGSPDPGGLPRWPLKALVPLAFALLALQGLALLVQRVAALRGVDDGGADAPTGGATP